MRAIWIALLHALLQQPLDVLPLPQARLNQSNLLDQDEGIPINAVESHGPTTPSRRTASRTAPRPCSRICTA